MGDLLEILDDAGEWWLSILLRSKESGYVPYTYITVYNCLECYDWFHGNIDRKECEQRLLAPGHIKGTFIVRSSTSNNPGVPYVLSVLDTQNVDGKDSKIVKHYRIHVLNDGTCFISTHLKFRSVPQLLVKYKDDPVHLHCRLERACPKRKPALFDISRANRDHWQIDRHLLRFYNSREPIGKGQYGDVYKGKWRSTDVAIKTLNVGNPDLETFLDEAAVMKKLRHPKLIALYAVCTDELPYYIVTEFMTNGNLRDYLRASEGLSLTLANLVHIATQVAQGMEHIHNNGIVHRDLAARNVLVGDTINDVKIGDFGMAKSIDSMGTIPRDAKLPMKWTAPEAIKNRQFSFKSDVWSFGILLVELFTYGQMPYKGTEWKTAQLLAELNRGYRHPQPANCPENVYEVMLFCWRREPDERPTFEHLADRLDNIVDYVGQYQET